MTKKEKTILAVIICCFSFYLSYSVFSLIISNEILFIVSLFFAILPLIIYNLVIKKVIAEENKIVSETSSKIKDIIKLNELSNFKEIKQIEHNIVEREYSRKSLDRVTGESIIKYHIENNIEYIRTDIENAIYNINIMDKYNEEVDKILSRESVNNTEFSLGKYKRIEKKILKSIIHKKDDFAILLNISAYYRSNSGNVVDSRKGKYSYDDLVRIYNEWQKGNKYEETKRQERRIMNDDIRYNVLKRDNYSCQICGATAKDGAKLHVDHIIPVSRGGKTVMSNLQTLCDQCNIGKNDKMNGDEICPRCGGRLVKRRGKYGEFIGCTNYPKCHYKK